jgi:type IV pilus assembly protein PilN
MIEINLLPVREEKRKADVRQFALMLGATVLGTAALATAVHIKLVASVVGTRSSLVQLQKQIDQFKPQLEQVEKYRATKQAIESKLEVISRLERSRSGPLFMLTELSVNAPERLWLTSLEAKSSKVVVKGMSLDNELVALFMTALGDSPHFRDIELEETEAKDVDGLRLNEFQLSATLTTGDPVPAAPAPAPGAQPAAPAAGSTPAATGR